MPGPQRKPSKRDGAPADVSLSRSGLGGRGHCNALYASFDGASVGVLQRLVALVQVEQQHLAVGLRSNLSDFFVV
jgi:hypothetical protein